MVPDAVAYSKDFQVPLLGDVLIEGTMSSTELLRNKRCEYKQLQEEFRRIPG